MLEMTLPATQRADFTFKYNRGLGRHGWLRLTPAYSVKLVKALMRQTPRNVVVLDPFSGTGTTGLVAAEQGNCAVGLDVNPFLIWLGNLKCRPYSTSCLETVRRKATGILKRVEHRLKEPAWTPPIFNIERWWSVHTLRTLAVLRACLEDELGEPSMSDNGGPAWVAFCRLVIETSSAAFNHVSMSFAAAAEHFEADQILELYREILEFILQSCETPIAGQCRMMPADSRTVPKTGARFGKIITSPPYPNRISYIRELRPYMYWTKFLGEAREAGELDWRAIGGTWGVATSRLNDWKPELDDLPASLLETVWKIAGAESKNGKLLSIYVHKYFHDMHLHFASLRGVLDEGAEIHYIVGNSTFFGNLVDTAALLAESMGQLGFSTVRSEIIRKRNCNKALYEYNVSARWTP